MRRSWRSRCRTSKASAAGCCISGPMWTTGCPGGRAGGRWTTNVRDRVRWRILCNGGCEAGEGRALNEPMLKNKKPAKVGSAEFFTRTRARLNFDVPPGLIDPNIIPRTGDEGNDRMLEIVAVEQPVRPAAVLIPVVDDSETTVLLTPRPEHLNNH